MSLSKFPGISEEASKMDAEGAVMLTRQEIEEAAALSQKRVMSGIAGMTDSSMTRPEVSQAAVADDGIMKPDQEVETRPIESSMLDRTEESEMKQTTQDYAGWKLGWPFENLTSSLWWVVVGLSIIILLP
jgi:hypothetical protein